MKGSGQILRAVTRFRSLHCSTSSALVTTRTSVLIFFLILPSLTDTKMRVFRLTCTRSLIFAKSSALVLFSRAAGFGLPPGEVPGLISEMAADLPAIRLKMAKE
jgi:hypothetical protein